MTNYFLTRFNQRRKFAITSGFAVSLVDFPLSYIRGCYIRENPG